MSRRSVFFLTVTVVILYFSLILFILKPLHGAKGGYFEMQSMLPQSLSVFWCKQMRLRSPPAPRPTALASFPGSGNTWLRYLLQQSTGILTGSIYLDLSLSWNGFPAENVSDGSVLVVKSHLMPNDHSFIFKDAVLLIRHPKDAILAEFNRKLRGHLGSAAKTAFKSSKAPSRLDWGKFVSANTQAWLRFHESWLKQFHRPLHIVTYERLTQDTRGALLGVFHFLNVTVAEEDLACALLNQEGIYRRKKKPRDFDPFTEEMHSSLDKQYAKVMALVVRYVKHHHRNEDSWEYIEETWDRIKGQDSTKLKE